MQQTGLNPQQIEALSLLLSGMAVKDVAAKVGVAERTLRRWLAEDEDFQEQYEGSCLQATDAACNRLRLVAEKAIATLEKNLGARRAADQNRAAATLLNHLERIEERINTAKRIRAIEQKIAVLKKEQGLKVIG